MYKVRDLRQQECDVCWLDILSVCMTFHVQHIMLHKHHHKPNRLWSNVNRPNATNAMQIFIAVVVVVVISYYYCDRLLCC